MREVIVTGKTVEEASAEACRQLGLSREEVSIEILEMPARRLFKKIPAKVKAVAVAEEIEEPAVKEKPVEKKAEKPAPKKAEKPAAKKVEKPAEKPVKAETAEEKPAEQTAEKAEPLSEEVVTKVNAAMEYLSSVFTAMGAQGVSMEMQQVGEAVIIKVEGEDIGMLIGHRGETMENLSYLSSLVANRLPGEYVKLGLDVAGYRSKREKDLQALAHRVASKVAKTGRNYVMDPMNPYERRIIHSTVSEMEGVRSESRGEGADRRVVIYSTDPNARNYSDRGDRRSSGRNNRGRNDRNRGDRRSSNYNKGERRSSVPAREFSEDKRPTGEPMAPKRTQLIDDAEGFELFGKIEL